MSRPPQKAPPKKRNLAAKALRENPLYRPKVVPAPDPNKKRTRFSRNPVDEAELDE